MATIYELTDEYRYLLELAEDPDVDPEVLADTIEALSGEIEDKADGYAKVIAELNSEIAGLSAEIERLTNRTKAMKNSIDRMKNALSDAMRATGKTKFKTALFSFGIQKNPPRVVLDVDPDKLPDDYLIPQPPKVDNAKLRNDLKKGIDIGICHLEQTESLRIR